MYSKKGCGSRGISSSSIRLNTRGQVTVFIIIGILIVFVFAGILYFTQRTVTDDLTAQEAPIIASVPTEFEPLRIYTENCLAQVGKQGLRVLGQQGGYIYPDLVGSYSSVQPTDSDGLVLEPLRVPYWYYNAQQNDALQLTFASHRPELHTADDAELSIETQLSRYVKEKMAGCLVEYAPFTEQGFSVSEPVIEDVRVTVGSSGVDFLLEMPLTLERGENTADIEQFFVRVPLALQQYYALATEIRALEENYSFLEKHALDLIQVYSAVDSAKLPPTSATTFDLAPTAVWNVATIKEKIKSMLISNIPLLQFRESNNFYQYSYPTAELQGLFQQNYNNMILPLPGSQNVEISFDYLGWQPYLQVNSKGDSLTPNSLVISQFGVNLATQIYTTVYDISYPVLVTIRDPAALQGEGYEFVIALEANVRGNKPGMGYQAQPVMTSVQRSMLCDEDKTDTQPLKTIVFDSATKEPLEAVHLSFTVPEDDTCQLGKTNMQGEFEDTFPAVYGGIITLLKEGYQTTYYPVDTYSYKTSSAIIGQAVAGTNQQGIELPKKRQVTLSAKKKAIEKCIESKCFYAGLFGSSAETVYSYTPNALEENHRWVFVGTTQELEAADEVILNLEQVSGLQEGVYHEEFSTAVVLQGPGGSAVELVPGVYKVTASLIVHEELVIPEETRCEDLGCFTLDETRLSDFVTGQLVWDAPEYYVTITPEQLYGSQEIVFYVPTANLKNVPLDGNQRVLEDLQVASELASISQKESVRNKLRPAFI